MLVLHYPFFRLGEAWFGERPAQERVDLISYRQHPQPLRQGLCHPRYTLVTDLGPEPDEILANMSKENQYKIRRAGQRDELQYEYADVQTAIPEFRRFYDHFARQKQLRQANARRLHALAQINGLALSQVRHRELGILVWHAYLLAGNRARLLYSASHYRDESDSGVRNLVGRANRYHHWRDMLKFREGGIATFDWGGWYCGNRDAERLRVNRFKESFGGAIIQEYDGWVARSPLGLAVLAAARLTGRLF